MQAIAIILIILGIIGFSCGYLADIYFQISKKDYKKIKKTLDKTGNL